MAKLDPFRTPAACAAFIAKYDAVVADWPVDCEERDLQTDFGREVIYRGGPHAALARAQRVIPDVRTHLMPGANHIPTVDCPNEIAEVMLESLA